MGENMMRTRQAVLAIGQLLHLQHVKMRMYKCACTEVHTYTDIRLYIREIRKPLHQSRTRMHVYTCTHTHSLRHTGLAIGQLLLLDVNMFVNAWIGQIGRHACSCMCACIRRMHAYIHASMQACMRIHARAHISCIHQIMHICIHEYVYHSHAHMHPHLDPHMHTLLRLVDPWGTWPKSFQEPLSESCIGGEIRTKNLVAPISTLSSTCSTTGSCG